MGGGVFIGNESEISLSYNLIQGNARDRIADEANGGGLYIYNDNTSVEALNNTICNNQVLLTGGGVFAHLDDNDELINNIIWGNTAGNGIDQIALTNESDSSRISYCDIEDAWPGEGNINLSPMFVDPEAGDFHLRWDNFPVNDDTKSPCIDTGAPWSPLDPDSTRADIGALPFDQLVGIDEPNAPLPRIAISNYPNPFNASTLISYNLPEQSQVTLEIYDILGRKIAMLEDGRKPAGYHQVEWNAEGVSSGVYFYKLTAGDYSESRKLLLMK